VIGSGVIGLLLALSIGWLLITGLHHILNNVGLVHRWRLSRHDRDLNRFFAGDPTAARS